MNLLDALTKAHDAAVRRRRRDFALPAIEGVEDRIVARVTSLPYSDYREIQDKASRGVSEELGASMDMIARATEGLYVRRSSGNVVPLAEVLDGTTRTLVFDETLAEILGLDAKSARAVVAHLVPDEMLRVTLANRISTWMSGGYDDLAEEVVGE